MTVNGEPSLGEVLRRLEDVSRQLASLASQMAEDRREAAVTFVRQDVYSSQQQGIERRVGDLERDVELKEKTAAETRRQFVFLCLGIAIPAILGLLLAINNFVNAGGQVTP